VKPGRRRAGARQAACNVCPMRVRIAHDTTYRYERPVRALVQALRLTPRDHDGQHVRSWRIEPSVDGRLQPREDALGNILHMFSADRAVEGITVRVTGEVETSDASGVLRGTVERVDLRRGLVVLRDERGGRYVTASLRRSGYGRGLGIDDLRRGDRITLVGNWTRGDVFDADRIENVRSGRY